MSWRFGDPIANFGTYDVTIGVNINASDSPLRSMGDNVALDHDTQAALGMGAVLTSGNTLYQIRSASSPDGAYATMGPSLVNYAFEGMFWENAPSADPNAWTGFPATDIVAVQWGYIGWKPYWFDDYPSGDKRYIIYGQRQSTYTDQRGDSYSAREYIIEPNTVNITTWDEPLTVMFHSPLTPYEPCSAAGGILYLTPAIMAGQYPHYSDWTFDNTGRMSEGMLPGVGMSGRIELLSHTGMVLKSMDIPWTVLSGASETNDTIQDLTGDYEMTWTRTGFLLDSNGGKGTTEFWFSDKSGANTIGGVRYTLDPGVGGRPPYSLNLTTLQLTVKAHERVPETWPTGEGPIPPCKETEVGPFDLRYGTPIPLGAIAEDKSVWYDSGYIRLAQSFANALTETAFVDGATSVTSDLFRSAHANGIVAYLTGSHE